MSTIVLSQITLEELESRLESKLQVIIQNELAKIEKNNSLDKLLSPKETIKLFNPTISKVTLHNWTEQGKLKKYRIGGNVYYKYSEIMDAMNYLKKYQQTWNT